MSRPGHNQYLCEKKTIKAGAGEDFVFTVDEDGFVWRWTDFKYADNVFHSLTTLPLVVTEVKRKFAGGDQEVSMGQGDIPLDLFCRQGNKPNTLLYEEPIKGGTKITIKVTNTDPEVDKEIWIVLWGAPVKQDPYYVRPEDWMKITPFKVVELDRTRDEE